MAQSWGLMPNGFKTKPFQNIKEEMENTLKREVDPGLSFEHGRIAGVLTAVFANQCHQVWEVLTELYHSLQPSYASGQALDALCSITGIVRHPASFSEAKGVLSLEPNSTVKAGSRIKTVSGDFFVTTNEIKNSSNQKAELEVDLVAEEIGPKIAHTNSLAQIMNPTAGWTLAAISKTYRLGRHEESDQELRLRRLLELRSLGSSTIDAMCSQLKSLEGVESVLIKEKEHSFEAIVKGGKVEEIAKCIWEHKPLGISTHGNLKQIIEDKLGQKREISFSEPREVNFSLKASITVSHLIELEKLKIALSEFARTKLKLGSDVFASRFYGPILSFEGVLDVPSLKITGATEIAEDEIASLNLENIQITQTVSSAQ